MMRTCPACRTENPAPAAFCMACGAALTEEPSHDARKIVTALFCDLVGSTSLGEQHDPEILRPILERYFEVMRGAVEHHGGHVEKFIGDAVVAVFGLPVAHEDDALRAVRAALEMQRRLRDLNDETTIPLHARIGVTSGEVLVSTGDQHIIADAMNTASRLQSAAEPGDILIGDPTWSMVREDVEAEPVGSLDLRGKSDPVVAWRVTRLRAQPVRPETPLVGRERQLTVLDGALRDAIDAGAGVLVTILAPPGVGKSRLGETFGRPSATGPPCSWDRRRRTAKA